jgi:hypothetical protein
VSAQRRRDVGRGKAAVGQLGELRLPQWEHSGRSGTDDQGAVIAQLTFSLPMLEASVKVRTGAVIRVISNAALA